jgi:hypothetical protein
VTRHLHVIYLQTTAQRQEEGLAALNRIIARTFSELEAHILVVDNAITTPHEQRLAANVTLINGDNRCREFTGMDRGIAWLEKQGDVPPDAVMLLSNDTLLRDIAAADFFCLDGPYALSQVDHGRLLGHVDCVAMPMSLFGMSLDHWVRSNYVLCTYGVLRKIAPLGLPFDDAEIFSASPDEFFRPDVRLSRVYQRFLRGFLQGEPNLALWSWHSASRIHAGNFEAFKLKAKAILSEHYIGAKAKQHGIELADISRRRMLSMEARARIRLLLYLTATWRLVPRFRHRFGL